MSERGSYLEASNLAPVTAIGVAKHFLGCVAASSAAALLAQVVVVPHSTSQ